MNTITTCTKRRPRPDFAWTKCGKPGITALGGDGHWSFYCEQHAPRDSQGYPLGLTLLSA
jgi:hypothetical protein